MRVKWISSGQWMTENAPPASLHGADFPGERRALNSESGGQALVSTLLFISLDLNPISGRWWWIFCSSLLLVQFISNTQQFLAGFCVDDSRGALLHGTSHGADWFSHVKELTLCWKQHSSKNAVLGSKLLVLWVDMSFWLLYLQTRRVQAVRVSAFKLPHVLGPQPEHSPVFHACQLLLCTHTIPRISGRLARRLNWGVLRAWMIPCNYSPLLKKPVKMLAGVQCSVTSLSGDALILSKHWPVASACRAVMTRNPQNAA